MIVITFGTYDLLHIGHINIFKMAAQLGDKLIVGISTDDFTYKKKIKYPIYNQKHRKEIIESIKYIDETFYEESFEKKREYILKYKADILVMGSDWKDKFNHFNDICKVVYLERTPNISTTDIINKIKK
jgi:glycerol-3-phosphate cytidylyltransferase